MTVKLGRVIQILALLLKHPLVEKFASNPRKLLFRILDKGWIQKNAPPTVLCWIHSWYKHKKNEIFRVKF